MATGQRNVGEVCWINMLTPQPAEAREFFSRLLGWTYVEIPGMGHRIQVAGRDVGGLFDLHGPNTPPGTPPLIGVMFKVDSADAVAAKVTALGGESRPAFDILDQGRMAVCFDPTGANFDVWEPKPMHGTDVDRLLHGAPSWFELITTDCDRAAVFYSGLFGWTSEVMDLPGMKYTTFKNDADFVAGMMQITPEMGSFPPIWATYFTVTDVEAAAQEATRLGATVFIPPQDVPEVGRFCCLSSPQGVMFYMMQYLPR